MDGANQYAVREIRINPIVPSESVLVATARSMRPKKAEEAAPRDTRRHVETCPFCTGNEHMTPPQIAAYPESGLSATAPGDVQEARVPREPPPGRPTPLTGTSEAAVALGGVFPTPPTSSATAPGVALPPPSLESSVRGVVPPPSMASWAIRIVENLYPVLGDDRSNPNLTFGLQQTIDGYGRHEVVIDHPQHGVAIHDMSEEHLALLFRAYRARMEQLYRSNRRLRYVLVFKNFGPAAGASIAHTHSQIIAMPVIPDNVQAEVANSRNFFHKNHRCIFCSLIDEALTFEATIYDRESGEIRRKINVGQYVVERGRKFIAIKPFASRYEWEVHILPLRHGADYLRTPEEDFADLARVMRRTMARLDAVLGGAQYNFFLHSLPHYGNCDEQDAQVPRAHDSRNGGGRVVPGATTEGRAGAAEDCEASYHWHIEITPRTSIPTGFELGSGLFVNTVAPETAAEKLRAAEID